MSATGEPEPEVREPAELETTRTTEQAENPEEPVAGTSGTGKKLDEEYSDIHKIVLQGLLAAGFLDTKGVKKLFIGACTYLKLDHTERTTMPYVQRIVREINERVKPFDMLIKSASCEFTGRKFYIFLITVENPIFKFQTLFSKFELELYQKCMDAILRKYNNYSVPLTECMNFAKECEAKGSIQEAERFILRLIRTKYFAKYMISAKEFQVTMGFRGLREFEPVLRELYPEIVSSCNLCKMVLLHGLMCPNCRTLVHKHCFLKFIRTSKECLHCKIPWTKPGVKEEPIEMIRRLRDTAGGGGEADTNARTPAQFDVQQHVSGDEEELRENPPVERAVGGVSVTVTDTQAENVQQQQAEDEYDEEEEEEEEEEEDDEEEGADDDGEVEVGEEQEVEGEYDEDAEGQEEDEEDEGEGQEVEENEDDDEEAGENEEDENMEYEVEVEDQEEGVEDEENVEYENEDEEEQEEDVADEKENEEGEEGGEDENEEVVEEEQEQEAEAEDVEMNVEPPPTPSIRRSPRVSKRPRRGLNLSESDSD